MDKNTVTLAELISLNNSDFDRYSKLSAADASAHMLRSERGEIALREFFTMLENGGCSLDAQNFGCLVALSTAMQSESNAYSTIREVLNG